MRVLAAVTLAMIVGGGAMAQESGGQAPGVAILARTEGRVEVLSSGASVWRPGVAGEPLDEGDQVRTGPDGRAVLSLEDGAVATLDPDGETEVGELATGDGAFFLRLSVGRLLAALDHALHPQSKFEVHTPNAVIAVRGTEFALEVEPALTRTAVFEGHVGVAGVGEGGEPVAETSVGAGFETRVAPGARPAPAERLAARWEAHRRAVTDMRAWHAEARARLRTQRQEARAAWRVRLGARAERARELRQERRERWRTWRQEHRERRAPTERPSREHPQRHPGRPGPR